MRVAVCSMWRDSGRYIDRSLGQFKDLACALEAHGASVRFIFCESSSSDDTYDRLSLFDGDVTLVQRADDCPFFPSKDLPERWRHLAWVANGTLEEVDATDDVVIYVESDLMWESETMLRLLEHLDDVDVVSPLNVHEDGLYYDCWGSRGMDGRRFTRRAPFHPDLATVDVRGLVEVQSLAGCTAMVADVARMTRFDPADCYVGWNRAMRLGGWKVWCDPSLQVVHPC